MWPRARTRSRDAGSDQAQGGEAPAKGLARTPLLAVSDSRALGPHGEGGGLRPLRRRPGPPCRSGLPHQVTPTCHSPYRSGAGRRRIVIPTIPLTLPTRMSIARDLQRLLRQSHVDPSGRRGFVASLVGPSRSRQPLDPLLAAGRVPPLRPFLFPPVALVCKGGARHQVRRFVWLFGRVWTDAALLPLKAVCRPEARRALRLARRSRGPQ
jgi:hypothetical protein